MRTHLSPDAPILFGAAVGGDDSTVAGIPTPLALAVGAIAVVLVILVVVTVLTRHRDDDENRAPLDLEK